jgi:hypothetical protein
VAADNEMRGVEKEHAAVWLSRIVEANPPNTFDIILLGPLTNLVLFLSIALIFSSFSPLASFLSQEFRR